ncbi:HalOD1 output domain-containing protein [Natrononativus amylolyticus]|uniref:HalOD1 output domain-containing protein n=1 Tax=Natrononativus amylolyticus TaxID=2963434 RepID=UPI0020CBFF45|nr:HalOD1 output domain-containing protein [Natrononativus amylolyticus]
MNDSHDKTSPTETLDGGNRPVADAQAHYDHDDPQDLTTTIIFAVADAEGVEPPDIKTPPLYDSVDTVAVEEALFGPAARRENHTGDESLTFSYRGHEITVRSDGWVFVGAEADH